MNVELLRSACLKKVTENTEMMWYFLPRDSRIAKGAIWRVLGHSVEAKLRLTLDYEEDFWILQTLIRQLGSDCTRDDILKYLSVNPGLTDINFFRQEQWKAGQNV